MTCRRLIEVDLPIRIISAHARREKSIRHGHISTLHLWWARRPLAACRAVLCAALWPDPADPECPPAFRQAAARIIIGFAQKVLTDRALAESCSPEAFGYWNTYSRPNSALDPANDNHLRALRTALLLFIGDFADWDNSTVPAYLESSRALTQAAHEALGGLPGTRPLVVDPFAGGGAIPLEALRVGADAFASDLNPVAVLLNKVVLEYIPKYGQQLADEVRKWGAWVKEQAEKELAQFYPSNPQLAASYAPEVPPVRKVKGVQWRLEGVTGETPIAYLWARTIRCEGPGCGAEVPLVRSLWLAKKGERSVALQFVTDRTDPFVDFELIEKRNGQWVRTANPAQVVKEPRFDGTVKRGSATCPVCGYTTPVTRVRSQLRDRHGGTNDARLMAVVVTLEATRNSAPDQLAQSFDEDGRFYRLATLADLQAIKRTAEELECRRQVYDGPASLVPNEDTPLGGGSGAGRAFSQRNYGMASFSDLFTARQLLVLSTLAKYTRLVGERAAREVDSDLAEDVQVCLGLHLNRQADYLSSLCTWHYNYREKISHTFARPAISFVWDFAETVFFGSGSGNWTGLLDWTHLTLANSYFGAHAGSAQRAPAQELPLPNDTAQFVFTDPPYYDAIPYSDLSDFFYVWLRRTLPQSMQGLVALSSTPKDDEAIVDEIKGKDKAYFELVMGQAMAAAARALDPDGIGVVVFAHKTTSGWEAQLQAMIEAGWIITASWPIDTEMGTRLRAHDSAALGSSVHLVCRRRVMSMPNKPAVVIGDWRDVLVALPKRIREWMPRLAQDGVVGADAIFACLGPALEIFSQYERVETAGGKVITLREYLEHVWAAVGREALNQIFAGADPTGFEEDGRLTALWLWTLSGQGDDPAGRGASSGRRTTDDGVEDEEEIETGDAAAAKAGATYALEYDTARKLAQGIGAHLEDLDKPGGVVTVQAETARLRTVTERRRALLGQGLVEVEAQPRRRKKGGQQMVFAELEEQVGPIATPDGEPAITPGATTLDRIHQAMLLFGAGRGDALKRLLVEDGAGRDAAFWRLAQALSALYPAASQEKRWVDGVLARKKGLAL